MNRSPNWSASPLAREPDPHTIMAMAASEGEWLVPVELVLACTSSVIRAVVTERRAKGQRPHRTARVIARGDRYFATIFYGDGRPDLFLALDCWSWEEWS
jgi:hypothetical protein